ncbi:hypothetical protein H072_5635 [Dactylellina haptotyla CBS 200.50]|uniref:SnoaL-like domain-containing protein n=1 Tax=Dactylellina haptotyla (strain CBS 200.50) TaxID=1284197 RepID=S8AC44_DACHA|nr:hypothetical protein H072_5635 [Dactylellina haptotyla CBS 200.50]
MKVSTIITTLFAITTGVLAAPTKQLNTVVPPAPPHPNDNIFSLMISNKHQKDFDGWFLTLTPNFNDGINMIVPSLTGYDRFGLSQGGLYEVIPGTEAVLWAGFSQLTESGQIRPFAFANDGPQVFTFMEAMAFTNDGRLQIDGKSKWALCTYKDVIGREYGKVLSWLDQPFIDPFRKCDNVEIRRV